MKPSRSSKKATGLPKLIRDRIPELIRQRGAVPTVRTARRSELRGLVLRKLQEEVVELCRDPSMEELADVYEVLRALVLACRFEATEIARVQMKKRRANGAFRRFLVLESIQEPRRRDKAAQP